MANNQYVNKVEYFGQTLIDISSDTVTANDILASKTAHDKSGAPITGNITNKGSTGITVSGGTSANIPAGYYNGSGNVNVSDANLVSGNIKDGVTILGVTGDYQGGGGGTSTSLTVTPSVNSQVILPATYSVDYFDEVDVNAIPYSETDNVAGGKTADIGDNATPTPPSGGPGWLPSSADYSWQYVYFNQYATTTWSTVLPLLTYTYDSETNIGECIIARAYSSDGVLMAHYPRLVAYDFTNSNEGYGIGFVYEWDYGGGDILLSIMPVFSTNSHTSNITFWGESWSVGMNEPSEEELDVESTGLLGNMAAVINYPNTSSMKGWDKLWAGSYISFGYFDDIDSHNIATSIINNTISTLTPSIFWRWFRATNGSSGFPIRSYLFKGNTNLLSVELHSQVTGIKESAFEGCTSLLSVTHQNAFASFIDGIEERAFYGCTSLLTIDLIVSYYFTHIGDNAFANCPNLTTIYFRGISSYPEVTLGANVFDTTSLQHIYVPANVVSVYQSAWSQYASYISAIPS